VFHDLHYYFFYAIVKSTESNLVAQKLTYIQGKLKNTKVVIRSHTLKEDKQHSTYIHITNNIVTIFCDKGPYYLVEYKNFMMSCKLNYF
jgi:hypothetical protein